MRVFTYQNEGIKKPVYELKDKALLTNMKEKKLLVRKKGTAYVLKIKPQLKSNKIFKRIPLKYFSLSNIWFAQFPSKEDLFIFRYEDDENKFLIKIFKNQWKYHFLLLNIISLTSFHIKERK